MLSARQRREIDIPIDQLIPHRAPMQLIDRLLSVADDQLQVAVIPRQSALFANADGSIPAYVGVEYMAQAIAAFAGLEALREARPQRLGFLLGARRYQAQVEQFAPDAELVVTARQLIRDESDLVLFDCAIHLGDACVAQAQIKAIAPDCLAPMIDELAQLTLV